MSPHDDDTTDGGFNHDDMKRRNDSGPQGAQTSYSDLYARGLLRGLERRIEKVERDVSNGGHKISEVEKAFLGAVSDIKVALAELKGPVARSSRIEWTMFVLVAAALVASVLNLITKH